jgi:hypothetical protein
MVLYFASAARLKALPSEQRARWGPLLSNSSHLLPHLSEQMNESWLKDARRAGRRVFLQLLVRGQLAVVKE